MYIYIISDNDKYYFKSRVKSQALTGASVSSGLPEQCSLGSCSWMEARWNKTGNPVNISRQRIPGRWTCSVRWAWALASQGARSRSSRLEERTSVRGGVVWNAAKLHTGLVSPWWGTGFLGIRGIAYQMYPVHVSSCCREEWMEDRGWSRLWQWSLWERGVAGLKWRIRQFEAYCKRGGAQVATDCLVCYYTARSRPHGQGSSL